MQHREDNVVNLGNKVHCWSKSTEKSINFQRVGWEEEKADTGETKFRTESPNPKGHRDLGCRSGHLWESSLCAEVFRLQLRLSPLFLGSDFHRSEGLGGLSPFSSHADGEGGRAVAEECGCWVRSLLVQAMGKSSFTLTISAELNFSPL